MSDINIKERIDSLTDEMLDNLARLVRHNSELSRYEDGMPFGKGPADALREALEIAEELGFETKNYDNYCGYAQIGQGDEIIGLVAHLDIVPAGSGWDTDPFKLTKIGDTVYGRGVSDDKGAAIASLYTLKLLDESGIKLNKRVRVIFGCNEETGSKCMEHYNKVGEHISAGFTPDGEFPGIHGEKGMLKMSAYSKKTKIISMNGGFVSNAVCDKCETVINAEDIDIVLLDKALSESALSEYKLIEQDNTITIRAIGKSAHASTPLLGINAAGCTIKALCEAGMKDDFVDFYNSHIGTQCNGEGYGLNISDEYGGLTLNNGIVSTENGRIICNIDIRYPVTYNNEKIVSLVTPYLEDEKGKTVIDSLSEPVFYPIDSPLVQALYQAYVEVTGDTKYKPMVIGGGTYAKSIPGIIAFGCQFMDTDNHIHDANEMLKIEELKLQVEIYLQAVKKLLLGS